MSLMQIFESLIQLSIVSSLGIYLIFSNTIIRALKQSPQGAKAMVEINRVILNPVFLSLFLTSGLGSFYLVLYGKGMESAAGALFFLGTFLVTITQNVPRNNKLRDTVLFTDAGQEYWNVYSKSWLWWNHVRTISAITSSMLLILHNIGP